MAITLPLKMKILTMRETSENQDLIEVDYEVLDASDVCVRKDRFTTLRESVQDVARYTIDRMAAQLLTVSTVIFAEGLDQVLAPVGVAKQRQAIKKAP